MVDVLECLEKKKKKNEFHFTFLNNQSKFKTILPKQYVKNVFSLLINRFKVEFRFAFYSRPYYCGKIEFMKKKVKKEPIINK